MVFHNLKKSRIGFLLVLPVIIILAFVWWLNWIPFVTGNAVPAQSHPYHQLAYTKLSSNHAGNFTGDIYLLDVDSGEITRLTRGGETNATRWSSPRTLDFVHRPQGSVLNPFYLNVQNGTGTRAYTHYNRDFFAVNRSGNGQRIVTEILSDEWESSGYIVVEVNSDEAETLITIPDALMLPEWLPGSEAIVYPTDDNQVCVHDVKDDRRDCITGEQPALSPTITPVLVAYTTVVNDVHRLCVAQIENNRFVHTECYDSNPTQISDLLWRP